MSIIEEHKRTQISFQNTSLLNSEKRIRQLRTIEKEWIRDSHRNLHQGDLIWWVEDNDKRRQ